MPETIALLPLVESSFENRSFSKAGAAGIWQFTRQTGRMYLRVTNRIDERLDPVKATHAAARLLRQNYRALGNWPLAITAYNHGRAGMLRARKAHDGALSTIINDYDGPLFGYASMNFYAEFIAAVQVYESYPQYFGELVLDAPAATKSVTPAQTAKGTGPATPPGSAGDKYIVQKGDTLWHIARRFGTTIRDLMEINNLRISVIHEGQILSLTLR
ncbi:MAG: transglycosylase SLT domain-containing protein [Acidobacteria bacterium]|nr:transglycosylase SLT domain-containing protein [Acidobacteriota bacterium]